MNVMGEREKMRSFTRNSGGGGGGDGGADKTESFRVSQR